MTAPDWSRAGGAVPTARQRRPGSEGSWVAWLGATCWQPGRGRRHCCCAPRMPYNELDTAAEEGRLADLAGEVIAKDEEGTLAAGAPCRAPPNSPLSSLTHAGPVWRQRWRSGAAAATRR